MNRIVQARIDDEMAKILRRLKRHFGWTISKSIREGIMALDQQIVGARAHPIVGLGRFASGVPNLASKKRHLHGFGR